MGAIKSVARHGKYLEIVIKKPLFRNYSKYLDKIIKVFSDEEHGEEYLSTFWDPAITENKDIKLTFILRNYKDIEPYIEEAKRWRQINKCNKKTYKQRIKELEGQNKRLVALCEAYEEEHSSTFQEWQEVIREGNCFKCEDKECENYVDKEALMKQNKDLHYKKQELENKIEKAMQVLAEKQIKFINDRTRLDDLDLDEIMRILEGKE